MKLFPQSNFYFMGIWHLYWALLWEFDEAYCENFTAGAAPNGLNSMVRIWEGTQWAQIVIYHIGFM